jgi:sialate O-acetylesterase
MVYGEEVASSGPTLRSVSRNGRRLRLSFDHVHGGLMIAGPPGGGDAFAVSPSLRGFEVRGDDGKWFPARAVIEGKEIVLVKDGVEHPVSARYAWSDPATGNLYNSAGLPAPPFSMDREGASIPVRRPVPVK